MGLIPRCKPAEVRIAYKVIYLKLECSMRNKYTMRFRSNIFLFLIVGMIVLSSLWVVDLGYHLFVVGENVIGCLLLILVVPYNYFMVKWVSKKKMEQNRISYGVFLKDFFIKTYVGVSLAIVLMGMILLIANVFFGIQIGYTMFDTGSWKQFLIISGALISISICEELGFRQLFLISC